MELKFWLKNINKINIPHKREYLIQKTFKATLAWIYKTEYRGGCHDTSAVLYMLLNEQGIEAKLCMGEVMINNSNFFDHSWVDVGGLILDASLCMPNIGGDEFPPVYASKSLSTLDKPLLTYGVSSPVGFDKEAASISSIDLSDYSLGNPDNPKKLWELAKVLSKESDIKINAGKLKNKYGAVKRCIIREKYL